MPPKWKGKGKVTTVVTPPVQTLERACNIGRINDVARAMASPTNVFVWIFLNDDCGSEELQFRLPDLQQYVFMILGGNDIHSDSSPATIAENLIGIIKEMKWCGTERVFFLSICQRGKFRDRYLTEDIFKKMKNSMNERMKKKLSEDFVDGREMKYPTHISTDGVHLNNQGNKKLKRLVMRTFKKTV